LNLLIEPPLFFFAPFDKEDNDHGLNGNKLIDAGYTLVGWINYSATDPFERVRVSAEVVKIARRSDAKRSLHAFLLSTRALLLAVTFFAGAGAELKDGNDRHLGHAQRRWRCRLPAARWKARSAAVPWWWPLLMRRT